MATTRTVTGTILAEDGTAWASKNVVFDLLTDFATTAADIVLNKTKTATTGVDGTFTVALAVPDEGAWQWNCGLPDGTSFVFNLAAGAPTTLEAIMADTNLSATVSASTLSQYIHTSEILDEDDMVSDSATNVASQQSIKAYVDGQVAGVSVSGTPEANDFARFTNANTLEGRSAAETLADIGAAADADLTTHEGDTTNPHEVTHTQAGAAAASHTHTESDVTDLAHDTNEYIIIAVSDETTDLVAGAAAVTFRMPYALTLSEVRASVGTAPTGSTIIVDINEGGTTILSTRLTIDATEKTSETADAAAVISDASLADDAEITIDIDQIGSSVAGAGLKVYLIGAR